MELTDSARAPREPSSRGAACTCHVYCTGGSALARDSVLELCSADMARAALLCIGILACRCPCSLQQAAPPPPQASTTSPFGDLVALSPLSSDAANAALRADNRARISPCDVLVGEDRDRECTPSSYYSQRGEAAFKRNQVEESCDAFDTVIALAPQYAASMWQRGLSLFYCERLEDGMAQFALDVTRNPNDTEESIWHYLCNARHRAATVGASRAAAAAQSEMLRVGQEGRPVMRAAMALYTGDGTVEQLLGMASADSSSCATGSNYDRATCYNYFYTHLCEFPTRLSAQVSPEDCANLSLHAIR